MRNQLSLLHFEKYIKAYPRKARKVLKEELERLENQELLTLNDKVNYIILAIKESEDIYDEYEDLNEEVKLNKLIFNMFSQTDQEDFE